MPYVYCSKTGKLNSEISNLPSMDTFLSQLNLFPFSKHVFLVLIFLSAIRPLFVGTPDLKFPYVFPTKILYASLSTCSCHCSVLYFTRQATLHGSYTLRSSSCDNSRSLQQNSPSALPFDIQYIYF